MTIQGAKKIQVGTISGELLKLKKNSTSTVEEKYPNSVVAVKYLKGSTPIGSMEYKNGVTTVDNGKLTCVSTDILSNVFNMCTVNPKK